MKQNEIAKELGISKSYLSMILSGQRKANPKLMAKLSSLGVVNFKAGLSLRGRCPKPLDECAFGRLYNQRWVSEITSSKEKGSPICRRAFTSRCRCVFRALQYRHCKCSASEHHPDYG